MIKTDIIIIGAGPVGLFAVFEAGLMKLRCHLIDAIPQPGGQLSEIYPIARGLSPLIIITISLLFFEENVSFYEFVGVFLISLSLSLTNFSYSTS